MKFSISDDAGPEAFEALERGLNAFNSAAAGSEVKAEAISFVVRDSEGVIVGGVTGRTYLDTFHVSILWLDESLRGEGLGKALMHKAEDKARQRGAKYASLSTLSWQARPFYEKLGWTVLGEMPVLGGKHKRYYMSKDL